MSAVPLCYIPSPPVCMLEKLQIVFGSWNPEPEDRMGLGKTARDVVTSMERREERTNDCMSQGDLGSEVSNEQLA